MLYPELVKVNNEIERNSEETETAITWLMLYEAGLLGARQEADLFSLSLGAIRTGFSNISDDMGNIPGSFGGGGDRGPNGALYTQTNPDGSRQSGRPAPGPRWREDIAQDPISQVYTDAEGNPFAFNTTGGGNTQFNIFEDGRMEDALAWLAANVPKVTEAVEEVIPPVEELTPVVEELTPAVEELTPPLEEAAPAVETVTSAIVGRGGLNPVLSSFTTGIFAASDAIGGLSLEFETVTYALTGASGLNPGLSSFTTGIFAASDAIAGQVRIIGELPPEVSALDELLAQMTATITDTAAATELQEMALAALSPELLELATELGLFGLRVKKVAEITEDALDDIKPDATVTPVCQRRQAQSAAGNQGSQGSRRARGLYPSHH